MPDAASTGLFAKLKGNLPMAGAACVTGLITKVFDYVGKLPEHLATHAPKLAEHAPAIVGGTSVLAGALSGGLFVVPVAILAGMGTELAKEKIKRIRDDIESKQEKKEADDRADADRLTNHDLQAAIGTAIGDVFRGLLPGTSLELSQEAIDRIVQAAPQAVRKFAEASSASEPGDVSTYELADNNLLDVIQAATERRRRPWGDPVMWAGLLTHINAAAGNTVLTPGTLATAAEACRQDFVVRFFNVIKSDFEKDGKAYASIQLRLLGELRAAAAKHAELLGLIGDEVHALQDACVSLEATIRQEFAAVHAEIEAVDTAVQLVRQEQGLTHLILEDALYWPPDAIADEADSLAELLFEKQVDNLLGREPLLGELESGFLNAASAGKPRRFGWHVIYGQAGSGKSRVALELLARHKADWSCHGFLKHDFVTSANGSLFAKQVDRPTLIVIDNASACARLRAFFERFAEDLWLRKSHPPVRVLLLDRVGDDQVFRQLRESDVSAVKSSFVSDAPLALSQLDEENLIDIVLERAGGFRDSWPRERVKALLRTYYDDAATPLGAATIGFLIANGVTELESVAGSDAEAKRYALFGFLLKRERGRWSTAADSELAADARRLAYARFRRVATLATLNNGLDREKARGLFSRRDPADSDFDDAPAQPWEEIARKFLGTDVEAVRYRALRPDLIAERFVLDELNHTFIDLTESLPDPKRADLRRREAWNLSPESMADFTRRCFQDFPRRTAEKGLDFLLPPADTPVKPATLAWLFRSLSTDLVYLCGKRYASDDEVLLACAVHEQLDKRLDALRAAARADVDVLRHLAAAVHQLAQILARAVNRDLEIEYVGIEDLQFTNAVPRPKRDPGGASAIFQRSSGSAPQENDPAVITRAIAAMTKLDAMTGMLLSDASRPAFAIDDATRSRLAITRSFYIASVMLEGRNNPAAGGRAEDAVPDDLQAEREKRFTDAMARVDADDTSPDERAMSLFVLSASIYARAKLKDASEAADMRERLRRLAFDRQRYPFSPFGGRAYVTLCRNMLVAAYYLDGPDVRTGALEQMLLLVGDAMPVDRTSLEQRALDNLKAFWQVVVQFFDHDRPPVVTQSLRDAVAALPDGEAKTALTTAIRRAGAPAPRPLVRSALGLNATGPTVRPYRESVPPADADLRQRRTAALRRDADWPLPPMYEADWQSADTAEADALLERLRAAIGKTPLFAIIEHAGVAAIRVHRPPFAPEASVIDLLLADVGGPSNEPHALAFLLGPEGLVQLDGNSAPVRAFNARHAPDLGTAERAKAYLAFFCGVVHGEDGEFAIVGSADALRRRVVADDAESERLWQLCHAVVAEPAGASEGDGVWKVHAIVQYADQLFDSNFSVGRASGEVFMNDDTALATGLTPRRTLFDGDGFRKLPPITKR